MTSLYSKVGTVGESNIVCLLKATLCNFFLANLYNEQVQHTYCKAVRTHFTGNCIVPLFVLSFANLVPKRVCKQKIKVSVRTKKQINTSLAFQK